ncbi:MAG: GtrA family protein [Desulfuromonadales bacterium]|nr:GtrA family protein [Desulfuromonadales bacterium]
MGQTAGFAAGSCIVRQAARAPDMRGGSCRLLQWLPMTPIGKIIYSASRTEFSRYFWAGSLTFLVDFLILFILTEFAGINYLWSNLVGVSVGILMSYLLCINWVFNSRRFNRVVYEFPLFILTCVFGILVNESLLWAFVTFGKIHYLVGKIIVTAAVFVVNFCLRKTLLFRH